MKPFRFGAAVFSTGSGPAWSDLARRVEAIGYSTLLLPDHFVTPFAPVPALAAAAAATSTLRVGTMVFDNDFRHPAVLAKDTATLDVLSDGRTEIGLGAGWHVPEYAATGISFDPAPVRIARLEESITVLKGLWSGEPFTYTGKHYTITGLQGTPVPVQQPHPPLMVGGGGRRTLELAAREADIVSIAARVKPDGTADTSSLTAPAVHERIGWIHAAAGDRDIELSNYYSTPAVIGDAGPAIEEILSRLTQRWGAHGLTADDIAASPHYLFGSVEQMVDTLVERRARFGFSYVVFTGDVERYAPVVSALAGT